MRACGFVGQNAGSSPRPGRTALAMPGGSEGRKEGPEGSKPRVQNRSSSLLLFLGCRSPCLELRARPWRSVGRSFWGFAPFLAAAATTLPPPLPPSFHRRTAWSLLIGRQHWRLSVTDNSSEANRERSFPPCASFLPSALIFFFPLLLSLRSRPLFPPFCCLFFSPQVSPCLPS